MSNYLNTLNADGSFNLAAIMRLAHARARVERNATICQRHGVSVPPRLYTGAAAFYAAEAAKIRFPGYVGEWSTFLGRELRAVWEIARALRQWHITVTPLAAALAEAA